MEGRLQKITRVQVQPAILSKGVVVRHLVRVPGLGHAPVDAVQTEGEAESERTEQGRIERHASDHKGAHRLRQGLARPDGEAK